MLKNTEVLETEMTFFIPRFLGRSKKKHPQALAGTSVERYGQRCGNWCDERKQLERLHLELSNPSHRILKVFLPQIGGDGDLSHQYRLALLELERLRPEALESHPELVERLCL